ncbi:pilus assembly protein [Jejubacter calystegiae]|uniref:Pilus assembly protein n=1 Tax=Jejubacter calystegiae TaxID=2579935 RepID=A0A4P8YMI1_9ENTR|nr:TadE family protein [Jejubacter calystegiae]QCT20894.1 pilus assembly protein [Jejubacter calystegiae]
MRCYNLKKTFSRDQTGVASIEFSLSIIAFVILLFFIAEIARMSYISAVLDLALSEASKSAKNASTFDSSYQTRFRQRFVSNGGHLWDFLTKNNEVELRVYFSDSVGDMIRNGGSSSANSRNMALARYQVHYRYQPMFFPFPGFWANSLLYREVIFVQEYERSKFMD